MTVKRRWLSTAAVLVVVGLVCLALVQPVVIIGRLELVSASVSAQRADLVATAIYPATAAKRVCPDTPLRITFTNAPIVGTGQIQVFDASTDALVESTDVAVPIRSKSIGGL